MKRKTRAIVVSPLRAVNDEPDERHLEFVQGRFLSRVRPRNFGDSMAGGSPSGDSSGQAGVAVDVELYAMTNDLAGNVVAEAAQQTLDGHCPELAHGAA